VPGARQVAVAKIKNAAVTNFEFAIRMGFANFRLLNFASDLDGMRGVFFIS
jgi:hypothetical protein